MPARQSVISKNDNICGDYFLMEVTSPGIGRGARPGQFFMVRVGSGNDPLLRRPFCLHKIVSDDAIRMLYRVNGTGTRMMSCMLPGESIDILGPLGNGFTVHEDVKHALIVAGGIGVAPLLGLAEHIAVNRPDIKAACFVGGRSNGDILGLKELGALGYAIFTSTEDGSVPVKGFITLPLEEYILNNSVGDLSGWAVYSCGPTPMLRAVAALCTRLGLKNYASLEAGMACGVGACMGCVVGILDKEHGSVVYKKVCEDGPVFDVEDVAWETSVEGAR